MSPRAHPRPTCRNATAHTQISSLTAKAAALLKEITSPTPENRGTGSPLQDVTYHGWRTGDGHFAVIIEDHPGSYHPLPHRQFHSPEGFAWGYDGNGPRDTARSILADALDAQTLSPSSNGPTSEIRKDRGNTGEEPRPASSHGKHNLDGFSLAYLEFTTEVIAHLPQDKSWSLKRSDILRWVTDMPPTPPPEDLPQQQLDTARDFIGHHRPSRSRTPQHS